MFRLAKAHGETQETLYLPSLRRSLAPLAGPVSRLCGMEHAGRGRAGHGLLDETRSVERGARGPVRRSRQARPAAHPPAHGTCRIRSRAGRRAGPRLGDPARRRSGYRQVDPASAGCRENRARRARSGLCQRRRGLGAGAYARGPAWPVRCTGKARFGNGRARHPHHARHDGCAGPAGDRFDPDNAFGHDRRCPRDGQPSPRLRLRIDPLRERERCRARAGRPCHQGRQHRGPARARTHGRCGHELRGRAEPPVSHPARAQEPFRRSR